MALGSGHWILPDQSFVEPHADNCKRKFTDMTIRIGRWILSIQRYVILHADRSVQKSTEMTLGFGNWIQNIVKPHADKSTEMTIVMGTGSSLFNVMYYHMQIYLDKNVKR
ncbi:hypothetical protein BaRGS_00034135 [Batillaria attramentaria]|uniref:Uncharacterized protein n=1 Tax=Batillaria attramentaria TaxID=370345 RepID=A0ABD0JIE2_9CAEN